MDLQAWHCLLPASPVRPASWWARARLLRDVRVSGWSGPRTRSRAARVCSCKVMASRSVETSFLGRMIFMPKQYPRELRERAVRLVAEHRGDYETEYAAIQFRRSGASSDLGRGLLYVSCARNCARSL
jgi:hypothetical protein